MLGAGSGDGRMDGGVEEESGFSAEGGCLAEPLVGQGWGWEGKNPLKSSAVVKVKGAASPNPSFHGTAGVTAKPRVFCARLWFWEGPDGGGRCPIAEGTRRLRALSVFILQKEESPGVWKASLFSSQSLPIIWRIQTQIFTSHP